VVLWGVCHGGWCEGTECLAAVGNQAPGGQHVACLRVAAQHGYSCSVLLHRSQLLQSAGWVRVSQVS
jgi:hypothetical protein